MRWLGALPCRTIVVYPGEGLEIFTKWPPQHGCDELPGHVI
jgi:hypothetical protein